MHHLIDGDHFLVYCFTKEDEASLELKQGRAARDPGDAPDGDEPTYFHFVEQEMLTQFLLVFDEGTDVRVRALPPKGVYYENIERKMLLKKKHVNDVVKLMHTPMSKEVQQEHKETLARVTDPLFPLVRADADADADGEVDDGAFGLNGASAETANAIRQEAIDVFGEE
ncbi:hypothetical protein GSI_13206 [Ganoderma sinense ZZ0214-1]|uniref:Uncharacterized protein n=1 Tax=Ganoderma sinense ZZ0214-1 TaxID=1077348 RepID=A0A2G8RUX8_9APHY|nr:hypothetical protein GSI_13206 [Ganoderma sinense ZZ0214-1]